MTHTVHIEPTRYAYGKHKVWRNATLAAAWCSCGWSTPQTAPERVQKLADEHTHNHKENNEHRANNNHVEHTDPSERASAALSQLRQS